MSKRFIDTEIFDDEKFMSYNKDCKLFWIYAITKCNHAGILKLNKRLIEFQTGVKEIETVIKQLDNSLVRVSEELIFIPKFIQFQYPNFPQSNVKQQDGALKILNSLNIDFNSYLTVSKELVNSYVNDNDNVNKEEKREKHTQSTFEKSNISTLEQFTLALKEYSERKYSSADMDYYFECVKNWALSKNVMKKDWLATAAGFMLRDIRDNKFKKKQ